MLVASVASALGLTPFALLIPTSERRGVCMLRGGLQPRPRPASAPRRLAVLTPCRPAGARSTPAGPKARCNAAMLFSHVVLSGLLPLVLLVPVRRAVRRAAGHTASPGWSTRLELKLEAVLCWLAYPWVPSGEQQDERQQQARREGRQHDAQQQQSSRLVHVLQTSVRLVAIFAVCCLVA